MLSQLVTPHPSDHGHDVLDNKHQDDDHSLMDIMIYNGDADHRDLWDEHDSSIERSSLPEKMFSYDFGEGLISKDVTCVLS